MFLGIMEDFYWFIGLFEGEGYIGLAKDNCVNIIISGSDQDVMDRVSKLLDKNYIKIQPKGKDTYKLQYRVSITGKKARYICEKIKPYMSKRRQQKITEVLTKNNPRGNLFEGLPFMSTV